MQPKKSSLLEMVLNQLSGMLIAYLAWLFIITPVYNIEVDSNENIEIVLIFTVISIIRGYIWRRTFTKYRILYNGEKK